MMIPLSILLTVPSACGPRPAMEMAGYVSQEEAVRVRSLPLESDQAIKTLAAEEPSQAAMVLAIVALPHSFGTRTGRFNLQVNLDGHLLDSMPNGSYTLQISGLSEQQVRAGLKGGAGDDHSASADGVVLVVGPDNPSAAVSKSDKIWSAWQRTKAVAIQVVATPPASTVVEDAALLRKLLSLDPSRWRTDSIRLLVTDEGLELDSIPANLPE